MRRPAAGLSTKRTDVMVGIDQGRILRMCYVCDAHPVKLNMTCHFPDRAMKVKSQKKLFSGIWWSFLFRVLCLWRHNWTSYSYFQTNVLAKFVATICVFFYTHTPYFMCHCI